MSIGGMRWRMTIEREQLSPDGSGGGSLSWQPVATVWADIRPANGREVLTADKTEGRVTHKVTMRYRSDVTTADRIRMGQKLYNIRMVTNPDMRRRWLTLLVEEGAPT